MLIESHSRGTSTLLLLCRLGQVCKNGAGRKGPLLAEWDGAFVQPQGVFLVSHVWLAAPWCSGHHVSFSRIDHRVC